MIAAINYDHVAQILGSLTPFLALLILPAAWFLNKKVIKPLTFVLGLKQEDSPTGEPIPSIPVQLSEMRKEQSALKTQVRVINAQVHPNGGSSMRDVVDCNSRDTKHVTLKVADLQRTLDDHLAEEQGEREKIAALTLKTAAEVATLATKTASDLAALTTKTASELSRSRES